MNSDKVPSTTAVTQGSLEHAYKTGASVIQAKIKGKTRTGSSLRPDFVSLGTLSVVCREVY